MSNINFKATEAKSAAIGSHRLPRDYAVSNYRLDIRIDLEKLSFEGSEEMDLVLSKPRREFEFHSLELAISDPVILKGNDSFRLEIAYDEDNERVKFSSSDEFGEGNYVLSLKYSGTLNERLRGLYKSIYVDRSGNEHVIATTHFEATDARRAFVSMDEPDRKATYEISITTRDPNIAISNWPVEEKKDLGNGLSKYKFGKTIPMSSYLVAFIVGPLAQSDAKYYKDTPITVVSSPDKIQMSEFALEVAQHCLEFFSRYFGINYPAPKLDLIALPDFAFGAMENLGAVTFRETALLADLNNASRLDLERVADVVSHEIAHMWFGDLVTMAWWNGIWLNEAFATFMEMMAVDDYRPQWKRWVGFSISKEAALAIDALGSTRPIEYPVRLPAEAEGMFDVLTYQKGAAVLKMAEEFLGKDVFRLGISQYLKKYEFKNTETEDLWRALEASAKDHELSIPVEEMMNSWIYQGGYPLIELSRQNDNLVITQKPFKLSSSINDETSWLVPISIGLKSLSGEITYKENFLVKEKTLTVKLPNNSNDNILVGNLGGWGFFRVLYDKEAFRQLKENYLNLTTLERYNLVSDSWANLIAGNLSLENFLELCERVSADKETDYNIWLIIISAFDFFERIIDENTLHTFQVKVRELLMPVFRKFGWESIEMEEENDKTTRALLIEALGTLAADPEVINRATQIFEANYKDANEDLIGSICRIIGRQNDIRHYDIMLERFKNPKTPQDEQRHLQSLGEFWDPRLVARTLDMTLEEIRSQDAPFLLATMLRNNKLQNTTWEFIENNWDKIIERFPNNTIVRMLESVRTFVGPLGDDRLAKRAREFLNTHSIPSGELTLKQSLERLDINIEFAKRIAGQIADLVGLK
jgi:puromycin-sensitive aminopeptidase